PRRHKRVVTSTPEHAGETLGLKPSGGGGGIPRGGKVLGVTAPPIRTRGVSDLEAIFGRPVYAKSIFELIVEGYLSPIKGLEVRTETSVEDVGVHGGDFVPEQLSRFINTQERNRLVVKNYLDLAANRKALVFAADLNHARNLTAMFQAHGVNAVWVSGETPLSLRRSFLTSLRKGEIKVIVNCMVF